MSDILRAVLMLEVSHDCVILCQYTMFKYKEFQQIEVSVEYNPSKLDATFFSEKNETKNSRSDCNFYTPWLLCTPKAGVVRVA